MFACFIVVDMVILLLVPGNPLKRIKGPERWLGY
jgi:hypothetical protein